MDNVLTIDKLRKARDLLRRVPAPVAMGMDITVSEHALKDSDVRNFPESRNRSRRIHKKLVKRYGGEFRKVPAMFKTPQGFIMHPAIYDDFRGQLAKQLRDHQDASIMNALRNPW